jgi:hypothetical protein
MKLADRTSIPDALRNEPATKNLDAWVVAIPETSGKRLFRFISPSQNLDTYPIEIATATDSSLLDVDGFPAGTFSLPVLKPQDDATHVGYLHDCSTYMGADVSGSVKPPGGAIDAALKTQQDSDVKIMFVYGPFESPLSYLLSKSGASQTLAYLSVLDLYGRNPLLVDKGFYVSGFRGALIFRSHRARSATRFNFNASAGASVPLASVEFHAAAGLDTSSSFDAADFATLIMLQAPAEPTAPTRPAASTISTKYLSPLPTLATINAYLPSVIPQIEPPDQAPTVYDGVAFDHWDDFEGVPPNVCSGSWSLSRINGDMDMTGVTVKQTVTALNGNPSCRLTIHGTPTFPAGAKSASFKYELRRVLGSTTLALQANRQFGTLSGPTPQYNAGPLFVQWAFDASKRSPVGWTTTIRFEGAPVAWNRSAAFDFDITSVSTAQGKALARPAVSCDVANTNCTITLSPAIGEYVAQDDIPKLDYDNVQVSGSMTIPVAAAGTVTRPIRLTVQWPRSEPRLFMFR